VGVFRCEIRVVEPGFASAEAARTALRTGPLDWDWLDGRQSWLGFVVDCILCLVTNRMIVSGTTQVVEAPDARAAAAVARTWRIERLGCRWQDGPRPMSRIYPER